MEQGSRSRKQTIENWGVGDFQDILDGVDLLIARGVADPDRLGVGG